MKRFPKSLPKELPKIHSLDKRADCETAFTRRAGIGIGGLWQFWTRVPLISHMK
jgi:hypothetical protein